MAGFTTLDNIPLSVKAKIDATVLLDPEENFVYTRTLMMKDFPKGTGDTLRYPKYSRPEAFTTPLNESELDVDPQVLAKTFIDAQINYYGTRFLISQRTVEQNPEDVLRQHAGALNYALRKTEDILTRETLLTTTTYIRCTAGENGDIPTDVSEKDLSGVISTLAGYRAKPISSQIDGANKFGTAPVAQAYMGVIHPDLIPDFESMDNFKTLEQYGSSYRPMPDEWGAYSRIRFVQTTQAPKEADLSKLGNTVYSILVLGKDAASIVRQNSNTAVIVGPEKVGALKDKYNYGVRTVFAAAMLFDQFVANVTCTRSTELE